MLLSTLDRFLEAQEMPLKPHQWGRPALSGEEGKEFGKIVERRFLKACEDKREAGEYPSWLSFFCAATEEEDKEGIDVWAYTDVGKIPLQIKSSERERTKFLRRENRKHIACVVVSPNTRFAVVFSFAISQIAQKRVQILNQKARDSS